MGLHHHPQKGDPPEPTGSGGVTGERGHPRLLGRSSDRRRILPWKISIEDGACAIAPGDAPSGAPPSCPASHGDSPTTSAVYSAALTLIVQHGRLIVQHGRRYKPTARCLPLPASSEAIHAEVFCSARPPTRRRPEQYPLRRQQAFRTKRGFEVESQKTEVTGLSVLENERRCSHDDDGPNRSPLGRRQRRGRTGPRPPMPLRLCSSTAYRRPRSMPW
jgi:hypothetical protein